MIILFVLLGVLLLGGGAATIIDGLPYLVLERGFTQVIVGTVIATGGVLMLALSRVLAELRRMRASLSETVTALAARPAAGEAVPGLATGKTALAAGAGLAAGAAAAVLANREAGDKDAEGGTERSEDEPDLFSQALSRDDADWHAAAAEPAAPEVSPEAQELPVYDEPVWPGDTLPELDRAEAVAEGSEAVQEIEAETEAFDEPSAATAEIPVAEPEAPETDPAGRTEPRLDWPAAAERTHAEEARPARAGANDEFDLLRESLAGHLTEPAAAPPAPSSDAGEEERLSAAESWISPAGTRREPWFEDRLESTDQSVPPQTGEPATDTPDAAVSWLEAETAGEPKPESEAEAHEAAIAWLEAESATEPATVADEAGEDRSGGSEEEASAVVDPEPAAVAEPAPAVEPEAPPADEAPAAPPAATSNEGIVGAYQVGDAHFTIYADGSIQARTPDGDYKFGSMEELKAYLASEKSRLGV